MNYFDILICIPLLWGLYKGFTKGFILELSNFFSLGFGIWGAITFSNFIEKKLYEWFGLKTLYLNIIAFSITFLAIVILVYLIAKLIQHFIEGMALGVVNKLLGALFGALKFALIISVLFFIINAFEKSYPILTFKTKEESLLYKPLSKLAPRLIPALESSKILDGQNKNKKQLN